MEGVSSILSFMGALLFLLGLLTGFGIPMFRSPRIGVSAHLDAIESGLGLIAFGLLIPHLTISPGWASLIAYTMWISFYVLWLGLLFGAAWGTGRTICDRRGRNQRRAVAGKHRPKLDFARLNRLRHRDCGFAGAMAMERLSCGGNAFTPGYCSLQLLEPPSFRFI